MQYFPLKRKQINKMDARRGASIISSFLMNYIAAFCLLSAKHSRGEWTNRETNDGDGCKDALISMVMQGGSGGMGNTRSSIIISNLLSEESVVIKFESVLIKTN